MAFLGRLLFGQQFDDDRQRRGPRIRPEDRFQPPENIDDSVRLLFESFRDSASRFREEAGLEWEHLVPGLQTASVIHFIRDRGKERTIDFLRQMIRNLNPNFVPPKLSAAPSVSPRHIANVATFNKAILRMADDCVAKAECRPSMTAHALSLLVIAVTASRFDLNNTVATLAASIDRIKKGRFDEYEKRNST
jgi:hypothetical protein